MIDDQFLVLKKQYSIPNELRTWEENHVAIWIKWVQKHFKVKLNENEWVLNGEQLYCMTLDEFQMKIRRDPKEMFCTHFRLLQQTNVIAIPFPKPSGKKKYFGNGNDIEMWEFLLDILEDRKYNNIIRWIQNGKEGEFKIRDKDAVSKLWGELRNNDGEIGYQSFSRCIRYYYGGNILEKANGNGNYRFICDIKQLYEYKNQKKMKNKHLPRRVHNYRFK